MHDNDGGGDDEDNDNNDEDDDEEEEEDEEFSFSAPRKVLLAFMQLRNERSDMTSCCLPHTQFRVTSLTNITTLCLGSLIA